MGFLEDLLNAVATAIGSSTDTAGFILGSILIVAFVVPLMLFKQDWKVITVFAVLASALAYAFGWFPLYVVILLVIVLAAMAIWGRGD